MYEVGTGQRHKAVRAERRGSWSDEAGFTMPTSLHPKCQTSHSTSPVLRIAMLFTHIEYGPGFS